MLCSMVTVLASLLGRRSEDHLRSLRRAWGASIPGNREGAHALRRSHIGGRDSVLIRASDAVLYAQPLEHFTKIAVPLEQFLEC